MSSVYVILGLWVVILSANETNDVYLYSVGWKGSVARGVRGLYRTNCSDQLDGDLYCEQLFIMLCMEYVCGVSNSGPIVQCMLP